MSKLLPGLVSLSIILFLFVSNFTGAFFRAELSEQRTSAASPRFEDVKHLHAYLNNFDAYYRDSFPYRAPLIQTNNLLLWKIFDSSGHKDVIVGKENWLYFMPKSPGIDTIGDHIKNNLFTPAELQKIAANLMRRKELLAKLGIEFYLLLHPNKQTIYPEYLPGNIQQKAGPGKLELLVRYLKKNTSIKVATSTDVLLQKKGRIPLYYETDSHWNALGAFFAYESYARLIATDFAAITPLELKQFEIQRSEKQSGGDTARLLGLENTVPDQEVSLKPLFHTRAKGDNLTLEPDNPHYKIIGSHLPKAYFLCDSFIMYGTLPFFSENFSDSYFVWHGLPYDTGKLKGKKLDIMVLALTERYLSMLLAAVKDEDPFRLAY